MSLVRIGLAVLLWLGVAARAEAAGWIVDAGQSRLGFTGSQSGAAFQGHFTRWQADIDFDPAHPEAAQLVVVIAMASAVTGDATRDQALPQADWFDVGRFPEARFQAHGFRPLGGTAFEASGALTIRGVSKPVLLPFTLEIHDRLAHARGQLAVLRSDFGVGQGAWSDGQMVALQVGVDFDLTARRP